MSEFDQKLFSHFYEQTKTAILEIDTDKDNDIYVVSFLLDCLDDDLRRPSFDVGYNTEKRYETQIDEASDEGEARWNYAFWLHNSLTVLGGDDPDFQKWVHASDYYCTDEEEDKNLNKCIEKESKIVDALTDAAIEIVQRLHSEGVVRKKLGRDVPILIHELEYYDEPISWSIKANPKNLIDDYINWYKSMLNPSQLRIFKKTFGDIW